MSTEVSPIRRELHILFCLSLLIACQGQAPPENQRTALNAVKSTADTQRRYFGELPWMSASLVANAPPETDDRVHVIGQSHNVQKIRAGSEVGWSPTLTFDLWRQAGDFEQKDKLIVAWTDGHRHECQVQGRQQSARHIRVGCRAHQRINSPDNHLFLGADASASVRYWDSSEDEIHDLGNHSIQVMRIEPLKGEQVNFRIDWREHMTEAMIFIRPFGTKIPPQTGEQPHISLILQYRTAVRGHVPKSPRLNCQIGEQQLFAGIYPDSRYSRQIDWAQGHPEGWPNRPMDENARQWIYWRRVDFPLPYQIGSIDNGLPTWPKHGKWQCQIDWEGETVRSFEMTVEYDGRIQVGKETPLVGAGWPIALRIHPSIIEDGGK